MIIFNKKKKDNPDTRIILITGTPAINNPFEIALIFNLLRPDTFPNSETKFREIYIKDNKLNNETKNMFQRRLIGLVSHYSGGDPTLFAEKRMNMVTVNMHPYHQEMYEHYEQIEDKIEKSKARSGKNSKIPSTYKSFTRQSCNFVFPTINSKINGETRPRPSQFKTSVQDIQRLLEGKEVQTKDNVHIQYIDIINLYMKELNNYFKKVNENDLKNKKSLLKDVDVFINKYKYNYDKFWKEYKDKSDLLNEFYKCSCKITAMIFQSLSSKGPLIMYSTYVRMEGIEVIKLYLKFFGFSSYSPDKNKENKCFTEFHGGISFEERERNKKIFNKKENLTGKLIKIILISPAGAEGISLMNVRQVHVLEPYWNEIRINQLIGRAIRQCSHGDLPMEERYVDVYRYISARKNKKQTTDENIQDLADKKYKLINSFLDTLKEIAVDCELFKTHNARDKEYRCFKFNQDSLFEKNIGPAFKQDLDYDVNFNNGLNALNSDTVKIEVTQIKAVKKLEDNKYSSEIDLNFDLKTGIVYDIDLNFPIGKIYFDEDGIPEMLNNKVFIISELIPIPTLTN